MTEEINGGSGPHARWVAREAQEPEHPGNKQLLEYYETLRGERDMPSRSEIDLKKLAGILDSLILIEPVGGGSVKYRLIGSEIERRIGLLFTGRAPEDFFTPDSVEQSRLFHQRVMGKGERVVLRGTLEGLDIEHVDFEAMILPIRAKDGLAVWAIGGVFAFN